MVVYKRDGASNFLVAELLAMFHQVGPDHVGDGLGAVGVTLLPHHSIELVQQLLVDRDGESSRSGGLTMFHIVVLRSINIVIRKGKKNFRCGSTGDLLCLLASKRGFGLSVSEIPLAATTHYTPKATCRSYGFSGPPSLQQVAYGTSSQNLRVV